MAGFQFEFATEEDAARLRPYLEAMVANPRSLPGYTETRKGKIRKSYTYRFDLDSKRLFCKIVRAKSPLALVKDLFRPSRARNVWQQTKRLQERGFAVPRLVAFAERKTGPFVVESLLLNEEVENAIPLSEYLRIHCCQPGKHRERWRFVRQLGEFVGRMHHQGIAHGDLRLNNLLVQSTSDGVRFVLIDNDRTTISPHQRERLFLKNLQQVNLIFLPHLTFTDRLRFFDAYQRARGRSDSTRRSKLREVVASLERRLHRYIAESGEELPEATSARGYREMMRKIGRSRSGAKN